VVDDEEIIKTHVHTDNPGKALQKALGFGQLITVKVENMREQHAEQQKAVQKKAKSPNTSLLTPRLNTASYR